MTAPPDVVRSAANPRYKALRHLAHDNTAWRKQGRIWLEGDHLCRAAVARGVRPELAVRAESSADVGLAAEAAEVLVLDDALFRSLSPLESPSDIGFVLALPAETALDAGAATVVLDRLQDAGNVGSILRSASAFGFRQVIAMRGTAALWSPKVLRAGMGAHFALQLFDARDDSVLDALRVPLLATSSHGGALLHEARLPWPCAWMLGHEGQGLSSALAARASLQVRIAQPGGEESLNVGAAAAICLHASATHAWQAQAPGG